MIDTLPPCPECAENYTYEQGNLLVCPMCAHEWIPHDSTDAADSADDQGAVVKDAVGNILNDGDTVSIVKNLKVKGTNVLRSGTKVRDIRLLEDPIDGHDIDATVPGFGKMNLKSSVVKKTS